MRQTQKYKHNIFVIAVLSFCLIILGSCNLERFRHEKYICNYPRLDIYEIIVRHAKKGGIVKIIGSTVEQDAVITSVNKKLMLIQGDGISLRVEREGGQITAHKRNKYYRFRCNLDVFTL